MRKCRFLIPALLCTLLLLGCSIVSVERKDTPNVAATISTIPATMPTSPTQTHPETIPTEPETLPAATEPLHSPLFIPNLPVEDVIRYFQEVSLGAEYVNAGNPSLVQKWTVPLVYQLHGTPTTEDLEILDGFAAQLNQIYGFPGIREAKYPEEANLNIHFCSRDDFLTLMGNDFLGADGGVTFWYEKNEIYNGIIGICTDLDQQLRNSVIMEEIYNGLGPVQDTALRSDSLIWTGFSQPQQPTDVDWLILELLYHPDIKCGMNFEDCEAIIRSLYY